MARTIMPVRKVKSADMGEIGSTGLKHYSGYINEEFHPKLRGRQAIKVYTEMRDNDPIVGSILFIIDKLLRSVEWKIEPANETPAAKEQADFIKECMDDMEHSWGDFISEILSMLPFGWSAHEMVFKIRGGLDKTDKSFHSKYNDGKVGWRKLPLRSQDSLSRWIYAADDSDTIIAMEQFTTTKGTKIIPIEKLILFKTQSFKSNPEGRSILRNAYRSWFFKKRIEEIEGIGVERDLAGLPVAHVPPSILSSQASDDEKAILSTLQTLISNIRRDEQEGVIFPLAYDENGKELYKLELLSTGGTRQFDTSGIVMRYDKRIAMTVLADFIFLGQDKVGSFALSSDKTSLFSVALGAWKQDIVDIINRVAIKTLMEINNVPLENWPKAAAGDIEKNDIAMFAEVIYKLVGVGALLPDDSVDHKIRELLGLPIDMSKTNLKPIDFVEQRFDQGEMSPADAQADFRNTGDPAVMDGKGKKPVGESTAKPKSGKGSKPTQK